MSMSSLLSRKQTPIAIVDLRAPPSMDHHRRQSTRRGSAASLEVTGGGGSATANSRRSLPVWPQHDARPDTPSSDGRLTPPTATWRGGRRNSDVGPSAMRTSSLSNLAGKQAIGGLAAASLVTGRRRANSDLDAITSSTAAVSQSASMLALSSASSTSTLTISARRDRDPKKSALYKTELCRSFEETGHCRYGTKCQFAHGNTELRQVQRHPKYKTEICRTFWEKGTCPYGKRCCFIHNEGPGGLAGSANGSAVSLISEPMGEMPASTGAAAANGGFGSSCTSSVTSSPMLAAMRASHVPDHPTLPVVTATAVTTATGHASASYLPMTAEPGSMVYSNEPARHSMPMMSTVPLAEGVPSTWPSAVGAAAPMSGNALGSFPSPPCLLSADLMKQLDLQADNRPRRQRAWTIDAVDDGARFDAPGTMSGVKGGMPMVGSSHVALPTPFYSSSPVRASPNFSTSAFGDSATSLIPVSPALSAVSVHSASGGPLTPPVLGPVGTSAPANISGNLLPMPVVGAHGSPVARAINNRPRSASTGTVNHPALAAQPHGPSQLGNGSGTTEQRRLPVFRRMGHS